MDSFRSPTTLLLVASALLVLWFAAGAVLRLIERLAGREDGRRAADTWRRGPWRARVTRGFEPGAGDDECVGAVHARGEIWAARCPAGLASKVAVGDSIWVRPDAATLAVQVLMTDDEERRRRTEPVRRGGEGGNRG